MLSYYIRNREKCKAYDKAYRAQNLEKIRARNKAYHVENREKIRARKRAYDLKNREKIKARKKAYRLKNKALIAAAPDLLAALKNAARWFVQPGAYPEFNECRAQIAAAIMKAEKSK